MLSVEGAEIQLFKETVSQKYVFVIYSHTLMKTIFSIFFEYVSRCLSKLFFIPPYACKMFSMGYCIKTIKIEPFSKGRTSENTKKNRNTIFWQLKVPVFGIMFTNFHTGTPWYSAGLVIKQFSIY